MLIDDVRIEVIAGKGGNGAVAFNRNKMELGPTGGTGGNGGSVWCVGVADIGALAYWRNRKEAAAEVGEEGHVQYRDGKDGTDFEFSVPVGTVVHNETTGDVQEIIAIGQRIRIARGGKGGRGNFHFRSSLNTSPQQFGRGTPGEHYPIHLTLKLIADIGLIGLPNAGKSSLMNELTRSQQKVANYPFTTLEPGLGAYYELILADIPGLIEGASTGKGLGIKFLQHVERTRELFHLVSAESDNPVRDWQVIRAELGAYSPALLQKSEHVFLSKTDLVDPEIIKKYQKQFSTAGVEVLPLSLHDSDTLEQVHVLLRKSIAAKTVAA